MEGEIMAMSTADANTIDNMNPDSQKVGLGTEVKANQDNITNVLAGTGITLPTSDPSSAGALWSDSGTVKVSAG